MARTPIAEECLKYYRRGYADGWGECIRRLRRLGIPEDYFRRITVKHKHRGSRT